MHRVGSVVASLGAMTLATACLNDRPVGPRDAVLHFGLRANIDASVAVVDRTVGIQTMYGRTSGEQIPLSVEPSAFTVPAGTTVSQSLTLNIGPCLDDAQRIGASDPGCRFTLVLSLRNAAGEQLSVDSRQLDSRDFEGTSSRPLAIALRAPTLVASPSAVEFTADAGQANLPREQTATITPDIAGAPIGTLSTSIAYVGATTNWLRATIDVATRRVVVNPTLTTLAASQSYSATVTVSSSVEGVQPARLTVNYRIAAPRHLLSVAGTGTGGGVVTSSPAGIGCTMAGTSSTGTCQASFDQGTNVMLTASPATGSAFVEWRGACTSTVGTCLVTMDQPRTVAAVFDPALSLIKVAGDNASLILGDTVSLVVRVVGPTGGPVPGTVVRFIGSGIDASVTTNNVGITSVLFSARQSGIALVDARVQPNGPSAQFRITVR